VNGPFQFHEGELAVQAQAGEQAVAARNGAVMSDTVILGARAFIDKQFMVVVASRDAQGQLWSSVLYGAPGFLGTPDGKRIVIRSAEHERDRSDPLWSNLAPSARIGLLFIEMGTRRRYRVNGTLDQVTDQLVEVTIEQAFPNCPKYIQRRSLRAIPGGATTAPARIGRGGALPDEVAALIGRADTLFVASAHHDSGLDASHRGGAAGFVAIQSDGTLRIPDFHGNSMFNTLGNIETDPRVGLIIPDFDGNQLLHLSGEARLRWDLSDSTGSTGGTNRFWDVRIDQWILRDSPQRLEWEYIDASPFNPIAHVPHGDRA
jgi:predicted pyridoxine 5'-phosphate oxidase superfamily flavin-nucleotide-binding protein